MFNITTTISCDDDLWTASRPWEDVWEMLKNPVRYISEELGHNLRDPFVLVLEPQPDGQAVEGEAIIQGIEGTGVVTVRGIPDMPPIPASKLMESIINDIQAGGENLCPPALLTLREQQDHTLAYLHSEIGTDRDNIAQYIANLMHNTQAAVAESARAGSMQVVRVDTEGRSELVADAPNIEFAMGEPRNMRIIYDGSFTEQCVSACNMTTGVLRCDADGFCRVIVDNVVVKVYCPQQQQPSAQVQELRALFAAALPVTA